MASNDLMIRITRLESELAELRAQVAPENAEVDDAAERFKLIELDLPTTERASPRPVAAAAVEHSPRAAEANYSPHRVIHSESGARAAQARSDPAAVPGAPPTREQRYVDGGEDAFRARARANAGRWRSGRW